MTGTRKKAAALNYEDGGKQAAPRIVAVGQGAVAERIIEIAVENNVPLYRDVETVGKLVKMPVGTDIPPELYAAVAKILAFIYRLEDEQRAGKKGRT